MKFIQLFLVLCAFNSLIASNLPYELANKVYDAEIKTVTLESDYSSSTIPIISINGGNLRLNFDDLLNEERRFYYKIIHCDKNWNVSGMRDIDFINGFNDELMRNYEYSTNTRIKFIHYWLDLPNENTTFKISGNYVLLIYEENADTPILTRRFIVNENLTGVQISQIYPADVQNIRYKQEFTVNINLNKLKPRNPVDEVSIVMLKNANWDESVNAKPSFFSGNNLRFSKLQTLEFWGLSEYREFDTRSIFRVGRGVEKVHRRADGTDIILQKDTTRTNQVHLFIFDNNGQFYIDNADITKNYSSLNILDQISNNNDPLQLASLRTSIQNSESEDERHSRSDYTEVNFLLDAPLLLQENQNIYILGAMNNWQPEEEYLMKYDTRRDMYMAQVLLKQGYYNYYYGIVTDGEKIDYQALEGSWNETENEYLTLAYYKGVGDLYDRVIGFDVFNTNKTSIKY